MKVVGFAGFSGSGKTTLVEQLDSRAAPARPAGVGGQALPTTSFDIDHPGKDSLPPPPGRCLRGGGWPRTSAWRCVREFKQPAELSVCTTCWQSCYQGVDWVLVEGFKDSDLPKIEVWRARRTRPV